MRRNADADYYGFDRDEDDETKEVERAREEGAPEDWTPIPGGWVVPGLDKVTEFLVERRKSRLFQWLR